MASPKYGDMAMYDDKMANARITKSGKEPKAASRFVPVFLGYVLICTPFRHHAHVPMRCCQH